MAAQLIKIGRSEQNDIVIDDSSVSRFHLELFQDDEGNVFITDLRSSNGTTVNGSRLKESKILKPNDIVKLGTASPLPWQKYFRDSPVIVDEPVVTNEVDETVQSDSNNWVLKGAIGALIAIVIIFGFLYINSFSSDKDKSITDDSKKIDNTETVGQDKSTVKNPPRRRIPTPSRNAITYDYGCMGNDALNQVSDLEVDVIEGLDFDVSINDEMRVGKQLYNGCQYEYSFVNDYRLRKLKEIKRKLVAAISNPRGFDYQIYLIESPEVNAFTAGGYIFVTTAMYNYVENDDEIACIVGHEIAHNECKHINYQLKKQMGLRSLLGDYFDSASEALDYFLSAPFNQKKETECDFHGIDYAVTAGYNSCRVINLWARMGEGETETNVIDGMMRTHPYSATRSQCCRNHIETNYNFYCN